MENKIDFDFIIQYFGSAANASRVMRNNGFKMSQPKISKLKKNGLSNADKLAFAKVIADDVHDEIQQATIRWDFLNDAKQLANEVLNGSK
jgi:hypothetical protein